MDTSSLALMWRAHQSTTSGERGNKPAFNSLSYQPKAEVGTDGEKFLGACSSVIPVPVFNFLGVVVPDMRRSRTSFTFLPVQQRRPKFQVESLGIAASLRFYFPWLVAWLVVCSYLRCGLDLFSLQKSPLQEYIADFPFCDFLVWDFPSATAGSSEPLGD